jgi:hypothetical protein
VSINGVVDKFGGNGNTVEGGIAQNTTTDDHNFVVRGGISEALSSGQTLVIYNGDTRLGKATVDGTSWTYQIGTPVSFAAQEGLTFDGNNVTNTGSAGWETGGQVADQLLKGDGSVSFTADETNSSRMLGLNITDSSQGFTDLDYAIYVKNNSNIYIYENGTIRGAAGFGVYAKGDVFTIQRTGTEITYLRNGEVFYTSTVAAPTSDLLVDFTLNNLTATLKNIILSSGEFGSYNLTARVENSSNGELGSASDEYAVKLNKITLAVADDNNAITDGITADNTPTLSGVLSANLYSNEVVGVYNGDERIGTAVVDGTNWSFTPATELADGDYELRAQIEDQTSGSASNGLVSSDVFTLAIGAETPTAKAIIQNVKDEIGDTGTVIAGSIIDDPKPTISGVLDRELGAAQQVAVYDGATFLGNATVDGTSWSFQPEEPLAEGSHSLTAVVESATGIAGETSEPFAFTLQTISLDNIEDNTGFIQGNVLNLNSTDDKTLEYQGSLGSELLEGQVIRAYDYSGLLGTAEVSGTSWTFTAAEAATTAHKLRFQIEADDNPGVAISSTGSHEVNIVSAEALTNVLPEVNTLEVAADQQVDLTLISGLDQRRINDINLGGTESTDISKVTLNLDDVLLAGTNLYVKSDDNDDWSNIDRSSRKQIRIDGDAGTVNVTGTGWTFEGSTTADGETYAIYNHGDDAQILIDSDLTRSGAVL